MPDDNLIKVKLATNVERDIVLIGWPDEARNAMLERSNIVLAMSKNEIGHSKSRLLQMKNAHFLVYSNYLDKNATEWLNENNIEFSRISIVSIYGIQMAVIEPSEQNRSDPNFVISKKRYTEWKKALAFIRNQGGKTPRISIPEKHLTLFLFSDNKDLDSLIEEARTENPRAIIVLSTTENVSQVNSSKFDYIVTGTGHQCIFNSADIIYTSSLLQLLQSSSESADIRLCYYNPKDVNVCLLGADITGLLASKVIPIGTDIDTAIKAIKQGYSSSIDGHSIDIITGGKISPLDNPLVGRFADRSFARKLSENLGRPAIYLNTAHHGISNMSGFEFLKSHFGLKFSFYIHDLIPIDWPEFVREDGSAQHSRRMETVASVADVVLVNSSAVKDSFTTWCNKNSAPLPTIEVCHIGVENSFLEASKKNSSVKSLVRQDFDYFVYVSTIEPRKNHILLLQIWRSWAKEGGTPPKLILIGKRGWENESVFNILDRCDEIRPYISEISGLSDDALIRIVKGASAVLFPSFDEGWGMPLVEAIALMTPVICSDIPVFHEASQELAIYLDPLDAVGWRRCIEEFCCPESELKVDARNKLDRFKIPHWDKHFEKALAALLSAVE